MEESGEKSREEGDAQEMNSSMSVDGVERSTGELVVVQNVEEEKEKCEEDMDDLSSSKNQT